MSRGIGEEDHPEEWAALQAAADKYAKAVYGEDYVVQDFITISFVVSMDGDKHYSEYACGTSSAAIHVNEGLLRRGFVMLNANDDD